MHKLLCTFLALWCLTASFAQVGSLDPTYGDDGIKPIEAPFDLTSYSLYKTFPADDGGQYQIYSMYEYYYGYLVIKKVLQNGELDVTYGNSGFSERVPVAYEGAVRHSDGKITVAGRTLNQADYMYWNAMLVRFNTDGTVDKTIEEGNSYDSGYETIQSLTLQNDKAVLTGMSRSNRYGTSLFLVILNPDGSTLTKWYGFYFNMRDYSIGNDVYMYDQYSLNEFSLRVALDGEKVVAAGSLSVGEQIYVQGDITFHFFYIDQYTTRYNPDGTIDLTFGDNGRNGSFTFPTSYPDDGYVLAPANPKRVLLTAVLNPTIGNQDFHITVYKADETVDESFGNGGSVMVDFGADDVPTAYLWQGDKLIVGGNSTKPETGTASFALVRLNPDGSLDNSFDSDGKQLTYRNGYNFNLVRLALQQKRLQQRLLAVGDELIAGYILEDNVILACTESKTVATDAGACSAVVNGLDPVFTPSGSSAVVNYTLTGATTGNGTGSVNGMIFNKGITTVTYSLSNNPAQTCSFTITVNDEDAPTISNVSASVTSIWPPNHKMVDVVINYDVTDNCGTSTVLSVTSNEPDWSSDREDKPGDYVVLDDHRIQLRAERLENGNGRTYTVTITATDAAGNQTLQTIPIYVPKSMGKNVNPAIVHKGELRAEELARGLQVVVMPNPSPDKFTLLTSSNSRGPIQFRVMDAQGKLVEMRTNQSTGTVQIGGSYRPGVYYAEVLQGSEKVTIKLIKQ